MPSLNLSSIFLLKSHTQNYPLKKEDGRGREGCPTTLLKLRQNWVICIEKGRPNNLALVTTILGNLYWKHYHLMKKC